MGNELASNTGGGLTNAAVQGAVHFHSASPDVFAGGEAVVRHLDITTHNHRQAVGNTPACAIMASMAVDAPLAPRSKSTNEATLAFRYATTFDEPLRPRLVLTLDSAPGTEHTTLTSDKYEKKTSSDAMVRITTRMVRLALWTRTQVAPDEHVELRLQCCGYQDGEDVELRMLGMGAGLMPRLRC